MKLGLVDLEILCLGIENPSFNETDIENSELKRLGVGRILDNLASLKERKLIDLNKDGTFFVTDLAKQELRNEQIPLWVRILQVLKIKPCSIEDLSKLLKTDLDPELENLRKNQMVLMSTFRKESSIIKTYEILPEGLEEIKKIEDGRLPTSTLGEHFSSDLSGLIDEVINAIILPEFNKNEIISKLERIKEKLR